MEKKVEKKAGYEAGRDEKNYREEKLCLSKWKIDRQVSW